MPGLIFTNSNTQWVLCLDGSVSKMVTGQETPNQGQWSSDLLTNNINLVITGGTDFSVPAKYSFNANNQLVVVVTGGGSAPSAGASSTAEPAAATPSTNTAAVTTPTGGSGGANPAVAGGAAPAPSVGSGSSSAHAASSSTASAADSSPYTFQGGIDISDNREVRYTLLDENSNPQTDAAGNPITLLVHGDLNIDDKLSRLVITFPDKSTSYITADTTDGSSVNATQNLTPSTGGGSDQLLFSASTTNTYSSGQTLVPATMSFLGMWDINPNGLVFRATGTTGKEMSLQVGGSYQGVAGGISVQQVGTNTSVAFTIQGSHKFQAPSGDATNVNWSVGLGYSNKQLDATVTLAASSVPANTGGNTFQMNGTLQFVGGPSGNKFALALSGTYDTRADGQLIFNANVATGANNTIDVNLGLQGKYTVKGGNVTFDISLDSNGGTDSLKVDFGYMSTDGKLKAHMQAVLARTPSGDTQVSFDFELTMQIVNGVLVPAGDPVPLSSSSGATASTSSTATPAPAAAPAPASSGH